MSYFNVRSKADISQLNRTDITMITTTSDGAFIFVSVIVIINWFQFSRFLLPLHFFLSFLLGSLILVRLAIIRSCDSSSAIRTVFNIRLYFSRRKIANIDGKIQFHLDGGS